MRKYEKCEKCKQYHWTDQRCSPEYLVYHEDYMGDEPKIIRANHHEDAALGYAQWYNLQDYDLMNETIKIKVVSPDGEIKFFEVGAEPDVHYTSKEINSLDTED